MSIILPDAGRRVHRGRSSQVPRRCAASKLLTSPGRGILSPMNERGPSTIEGTPIEGVYSIKRITYQNEESGYAVVYLVPADQAIEVGFAAAGRFGRPRTGDCFRIEGVWKRDPRFGLQVQVTSAIPETPRAASGIARYLAGGAIKGLGPHHAEALVRHFGDETLRVLDSGGERLEEVPGIGPVRARAIREAWAEHRGRHECLMNLQGRAGLTPRQAQRVYQEYGAQAWEVVSRDPYRLAEDVRGFGFKTSDRIARALGVAPDAPERVSAGLLHLLSEALAEGHLWCAPDDLVTRTADLLQCPEDAVAAELGALIRLGRVGREEALLEAGIWSAIYLPTVRHTEQRIAERLGALLTGGAGALGLSRSEAEGLVSRLAQAELTNEQREAVVGVLEGGRLGIITGGPGTGKTTTVRTLIACLEEIPITYALCATTGRASKQLAASTGRPAATVHRHLRIGMGAGPEPMRESVLIIDESSMIDLWLLREILERLPAHAHLVLVGDVDQLPSVGPGAVLQDLIAAAAAPSTSAMGGGIRVARLGQIFRQEAGQRSMVVVNCHRVRRGERPLRDVPSDSDYYEMLRETPAEARDLVVELVTERLPRYLNVPATEVQVLTPVHAGHVGTAALNLALQQALNAPAAHKPEIALSGGISAVERHGEATGRIFRVGDKVRQTRNNYQKQVLNGDLGTIATIDTQARALGIRFDDRTVSYTYDECDELVHAWAMTVHAAQGSQWPAVIIVMLVSHYVMLERNILYTALSRAERLAVLVSQERAIRLAVSQNRALRRRTGLTWRLAQALAGPSSPTAAAAGSLQPTLC